MSAHSIRIDPNGDITCLWTDALPLAEFGTLDVQRASHVEFNPIAQLWEVRLAESPEQVVFADQSRERCLSWEHDFFNQRLG